MRRAGAAYIFQRTGAAWSQLAYVTASEREALEDFQRALGIGHARTTDLVVFLTDLVAVEDAPR